MIAKQCTLFGGFAPPPDLDLRDRAAYILEQHPEARDDDALLLFYYWCEWDGLEALLDDEALDQLKGFLQKATSAETIRRRRQEIQKLGHGGGHLQPSGSVADWRRARDGAGPPRR